jgi:hypothetical protein
VVLV